MGVIERIKKRVKKDGIPVTFYLGCTVLASKFNRANKEEIYREWIQNNEQDIYERETLKYEPCISVIVPVYNVKKKMLVECIESVKGQTYENWQLCLVDDASTMKEVREVLKQYENDEKIVIKYREKNGHISRTTNDGLSLATGEFIGLLDCDDILAPNALYEMAKKLNENREYDFIYSDEDVLTENGKIRCNPAFKGEWAPDTFMSVMYTNHFSIFRKEIADKIGGYRVGFEGSQDYDFVLRFTEYTKCIGHVDKILYHWRSRKESVVSDAETKMYAYQSAMKAKEEALIRRGLKGKMEYQPQVHQTRVVYALEGTPMISIIIPSKDNVSCITTCLKSIYDKTSYTNYEVIVVDNGSYDNNKKQYEVLCDNYGCQYVYQPMLFNFSKMCNIGASCAKGKYLLFLNDDTKVITEDWLERMAGQASLSHTGAVGAKLYYPEDKKLQHIGVANGEEGPYHFYSGCREIKTNIRMQTNCNYSAVTGACLMVSKEKYQEVNGFDEELPIAYNDVDFCFKLLEKGYYNIVCNDVKLVHYESISRGMDLLDKKKMERLTSERGILNKKHPTLVAYDPFFSKNMALTLHLEGLINLKEKEPKLYISNLTSNISLSRENISQFMNIKLFDNMKQMKLEGWFYWKDYKHNNLNRYKVILQSEIGNMYIASMKKVYHEPEEENYIGNPKLTGYAVIINVGNLPKGNYKVYLQVFRGVLGKKYCVDTKKEVTI